MNIPRALKRAYRNWTHGNLVGISIVSCFFSGQDSPHPPKRSKSISPPFSLRVPRALSAAGVIPLTSNPKKSSTAISMTAHQDPPVSPRTKKIYSVASLTHAASGERSVLRPWKKKHRPPPPPWLVVHPPPHEKVNRCMQIEEPGFAIEVRDAQVPSCRNNIISAQSHSRYPAPFLWFKSVLLPASQSRILESTRIYNRNEIGFYRRCCYRIMFSKPHFYAHWVEGCIIFKVFPLVGVRESWAQNTPHTIQKSSSAQCSVNPRLLSRRQDLYQQY